MAQQKKNKAELDAARRELKGFLERLRSRDSGASLLGEGPATPYRPDSAEDALERIKRAPWYGQSTAPVEYGSPDDFVLGDD